MGEVIAVVGSRIYPRLDLVREYVRGLPRDAEVVSGGAVGVDSAAEGEARARGLAVRVFRPDWSRGPSAGHARNAEVVAAADRVVAFWDGSSAGTRSAMRIAYRERKTLEVRRPAPRVLNKHRDPPEEVWGAVCVGRPTRYGNPWSHLGGLAVRVGTREEALGYYRDWIAGDEEVYQSFPGLLPAPPAAADVARDLRGRDLWCWCSPAPCHAEVLIRIANEVAT